MDDVIRYRLTQVSILLGVARHQLVYLIAKGRVPQPTWVKGDQYYTEADLEVAREFFRTWVKWRRVKKQEVE